ncbi:MAG: HD domain-containing protein [Actinomycetota bacterium]|nr:HD domain-containing protein [Actinomycetota bacterium]
MAGFDSIASTPAERGSLERLRAATGESDGPMERHCLRCRHIAARIAARRHWVIDGEVLTVAALLHDIGLYADFATDDAYTADGATAARELLAPAGWSPERMQLCAEAIDRHHDLRRQLSRGAEVEALRLADLVDLTGGRLGFGTQREWLAQLFASEPRRGMYREIGAQLRRALRERPLTLPKIFLRP